MMEEDAENLADGNVGGTHHQTHCKEYQEEQGQEDDAFLHFFTFMK